MRGTKQSLEIKKEEARQRSESPFFVIGLPSCFMLPCFVTGYHAFGLKIATAALRPRNDTELKRFYLENGRFSFFSVIFCAVSLCTVFQTFRCENCTVSPQIRSDLSLRGGRILRPTRQSLTMRFVIPKRNMVERNEAKPWNEERGSRMKQRIHVFCDRDSFLLRAPVLRCGMPCLRL